MARSSIFSCNLQHLMVVACFILLTGCSAPSQQTRQVEKAKQESPIHVVSAKRGKSYLERARFLGGDDTRTRASDPQSLLLILEVQGVPPEVVGNIENEKIYAVAGEKRCDIFFKTTGIIDNKPRIIFGLIVPKDALEFALYVGTYPPRQFMADKAIQEELESR